MIRSWFVCLLVCASPAAADKQLVTSFETQAQLTQLKTTSATVKPTTEHATDGKQAIEVTFSPADWAEVRLEPSTPLSFKNFGGILVDITNIGSEPVQFGIRIDDDTPQAGPKHSRQGSLAIAPDESTSVVLSLGVHARQYGMYGVPFPPNTRDLWVDNGSGINLDHITAVHLFAKKPTKPATVILDNLRAGDRCFPMEKIVDEFGQFTKADWPGKVHDLKELRKQRSDEVKQLKGRPTDLDAFGGWNKGPKLKGTGYFRTEKVGDKWWLVTPSGHVFFSLGMDCVNTWFLTYTDGREKMFEWLPKPDEPLGKYYVGNQKTVLGAAHTGTTYNFLLANLERKYGPAYENVWYDLALTRLRSWGFNTVANWSDARLYGNHRVPYVITVDIGGDHGRISSGLDYWSRMHDPFDPKFKADLDKSLAVHGAKAANDPYCLGYFVDNEMSWGGWGDEESRVGLARGALKEAETCSAKRVFLKQLRAKYDQIAQLNAAWGTQFASWEDMNKPYTAPASLTQAARQDMISFVREFARKYFMTVRDAIRAVDPNHLYLGCRFSFRTAEALEAAAAFCDVVSFNIYEPSVASPNWQAVNNLGKPCIIGEFHIGATDRGMFHPGLVAAPNQQKRAAMYRDYVYSVADHPAFVGCHWFQYVDEPVVGRSMDGENYGVGFISVTDTPYPELVDMARETNRNIYARRAGNNPTK